jgi:hypothetical protein
LPSRDRRCRQADPLGEIDMTDPRIVRKLAKNRGVKPIQLHVANPALNAQIMLEMSEEYRNYDRFARNARRGTDT